jgi:antibiotic biosynthesis monooxygenase (ABM) superfamily enzyme
MDGPQQDQPGATEVITWKVAPGREADFENWAHDLTAVATRQEGHLGAAWLRPNGTTGEYHVVIRFTSPELLARWMDSDERHQWVAKLEGIASAMSTRRSGMETWFSLPGQDVRPPPKWKMSLVTIGAVYPLSVLFNWLISPSVKRWPLLVHAALFPVVLVPLLTFVVMPRLSQVLRRWLYGRA